MSCVIEKMTVTRVLFVNEVIVFFDVQIVHGESYLQILQYYLPMFITISENTFPDGIEPRQTLAVRCASL